MALPQIGAPPLNAAGRMCRAAGGCRVTAARAELPVITRILQD